MEYDGRGEVREGMDDLIGNGFFQMIRKIARGRLYY